MMHKKKKNKIIYYLSVKKYSKCFLSDKIKSLVKGAKRIYQNPMLGKYQWRALGLWHFLKTSKQIIEFPGMKLTMIMKIKFMRQRTFKENLIQSYRGFRRRMKLKWEYMIKRTLKRRRLSRLDIISIVIHIWFKKKKYD